MRVREDSPVSGVGLLLVTCIAVGVAACGEQRSSQPSNTPAPPEVGVVTVAAVPITLTKELPGRITPMRIAEVRPRVTGIV